MTGPVGGDSTEPPAPGPTYGPWYGARLDITGELVARSENSMWIVRPDTYCRMPLIEGAQLQEPSLDDALDDLVWHDHVGVFLVDDLDDVRLRIVPAGRPAGAFGVVTGSLTVLRGLAIVTEVRRTQA